MSLMNFSNMIASARHLKKCISYRSSLGALSPINRQIHRSGCLANNASVLTAPQSTAEAKQYSPKLHNIVSEVSKLTLLEVAELNELLKKSLNIPDAPMMAMGSFAAAPAAQEEEQEAPKAKTSYTVKLLKYDESKKVQLIKEIKSLTEGMNLVQAKKFVEGAPQVVRADIGKDEAEKIKSAVEAAGGFCELL